MLPEFDCCRYVCIETDATISEVIHTHDYCGTIDMYQCEPDHSLLLEVIENGQESGRTNAELNLSAQRECLPKLPVGVATNPRYYQVQPVSGSRSEYSRRFVLRLFRLLR